MVLAINMMDDVKAKGDNVDCEYLEKLLGVRVVRISARRNENISDVITSVVISIENKTTPTEINYGVATQNALNEIYSIIVKLCKTSDIPYTFYAAKLLEGDDGVLEELNLSSEQKSKIEKVVSAYEKTSSYQDREAMLADARYKFIEELSSKAVSKAHHPDELTVSDKIDAVVTNRFLAIPIFLLMMLIMFSLTFGAVGNFLSDGIEFLVSQLSAGVEILLDKAVAPEWTYKLLLDAVIGGVGGIIVFLPRIAILFFCLSILEDSGYMARAAFITDKFLRKLGLSGKSFIPMLMGFGCTTPAVMATRTQENMRERRMTIMLIPFMSCGAKLPIYALFAGTFFSKHQGLVVLSMYLIGFVVAILVGLFLKKTVFKGNMAPFIMELPPYRMPLPTSVLRSTWDKCKGFIIKAGTVIFAMSIVIWFMQNFTPAFAMTEDSANSIFGIIGTAIAPIFAPLGFGDWKASVSLLSGLVAKEAVVSTFGVLHGATGDALTSIIATEFTPLAAFSYMVFCLLYVPCISAFATIRREMGSTKWALVTAGMEILVAYIVALLIFQVGSLFI